MRAIVLLLFVLGIAAGQENPAFEVASVHRDDPSVPPKVRMSAHGGPGTSDPKRFQCRGCTLALLVAKAYDIDISQVDGPDWIWGDLYEVAAIVPDDTSIDRFHSMLQSLINERFKLEFRRETRETAGYELTAGPNVARLKEAAAHGAVPESTLHLDSNGFPVVGPGGGGMSLGRYRFRFEETLADLAHWLTIRLQKPVIDRTGLTARYDITLSYFEQLPNAPSPDVPLPTLVDAVNESGLKLVAKKLQAQYITVESAQRVPVDN